MPPDVLLKASHAAFSLAVQESGPPPLFETEKAWLGGFPEPAVAEKTNAVGETLRVWGGPFDPLPFVLTASSTSGNCDRTCENFRPLPFGVSVEDVDVVVLGAAVRDVVVVVEAVPTVVPPVVLPSRERGATVEIDDDGIERVWVLERL